MNKKLLLILCCFTLFSCDYGRYRYGFFEGNWVLLNYLDTVQKYRSVYHASSIPFEELYFQRYEDSISFMDVNGNCKSYPFQYKTSNSIVLDEPGKPALLYLTKTSFKICYDTPKGKMQFVQADQLLVDSATESGVPSAGKHVINSLVLGGIYKQANNQIPVQFYTNGAISGFAPYTSYEVALDADARKGFNGDVVWLNNDKQAQAFTWEWKDDNLRLIALMKDENGYKKTATFFDLHKLK